jgi:hypothetical protein
VGAAGKKREGSVAEAIAVALEKLEEAQSRLRDAMEARYPEGSRIGFHIRTDQQNLSWGFARGIVLNDPAYIVVRMDGGHTTRCHHNSVVRVFRPEDL